MINAICILIIMLVLQFFCFMVISLEVGLKYGNNLKFKTKIEIIEKIMDYAGIILILSLSAYETNLILKWFEKPNAIIWCVNFCWINIFNIKVTERFFNYFFGDLIDFVHKSLNKTNNKEDIIWYLNKKNWNKKIIKVLTLFLDKNEKGIIGLAELKDEIIERNPKKESSRKISKI